MADELSGADSRSTPPSFDFDDDAIATLLDNFVETQTGAQAKKSSAPPDPSDDGARTAHRSVFERGSHQELLPMVGDSSDAKRRRAVLLDALAARSVGSSRARLLTAAAELLEQLGEPDLATERYRLALAADARDVVVLRALRRLAMARRDWRDAADSLEREAGLDLAAPDRVAALKLLSFILRVELTDSPGAERAATRATELQPDDFVAWMLVAAARLARDAPGRGAEALSRAADLWPTPDAEASIALHAARLMERAQRAEDTKTAFERVRAIVPTSLEARLGIARAAGTLGDRDAVIDALDQAADCAPSAVADALRRAAAVAAWHAGRAEDAMGRLDACAGTVGSWTLAEVAAREGDLFRAHAALEGATDASTHETEGFSAALRARLAMEGGLDPAGNLDEHDAHPALHAYVRTLRAVKDPAAARVLDQSTVDAASPPARMTEADDAAARGDLAAFAAALRTELHEAPEDDREGALLALAEAVEAADDASALLALAEDHPESHALRRTAILIDPEGPSLALRWRDEAEHGAGARAAFAYTMAARCADSDEASTLAYERALGRAPHYPPALWGLEDRAASSDGRAEAALRQREAGLQTTSSLALLAALEASSSALQVERAEAALDRKQPDPILLEHLIALHGVAAERAGALMMDAWRSLDEPSYLPRAAAAFVSAGRPTKGAAALREASKHLQDDGALSARRKDAELQASEFARLADATMQRARDATGEDGEMQALAAMAEVDRLARRDMQSARLPLQSIAEHRPDHVPTARALEGDALRERDPDRIRSSARRLADALPQSAAERVARRRLIVELLRADPDILQTDVDRVLRATDEPLDSDSGLARQVLGACYAKADPERGVDALMALQSGLGTELERAALALEASQLLQKTGDTAKALEALNTAGHHPLALETEARLLRTAKRWEDAAASFEEAARHATDPQRVASLYREAACTYEESLGDIDRAMACWVEAARADITYLDVYRRLASAYREANRNEDLGALTDRRIEAGADTPTLVGLLFEKATQRGDAGDLPGVVATLEECLELDPNHVGALRALVDAYKALGEWQSATEALIRVARLRRTVDEQVWAFRQLGELYDERLEDLPRAEASLRRALELAPSHIEAADRLASVMSQQDKHDEATHLLHDLVEHATDAAQARDYRIRLATSVERAGHGRRAEAMLEQLRAEQPTEPDVILAVADYYGRQGASPAEAMHLNRALNDLREAIEQRPEDELLWTTVVRVLGRRHGPGAASCAASAAIAIGHSPSLFEGTVTVRHAALGDPGLPLSPVVDAIVSPRGLPAPARRLFALCEHAFDKMLPFDASAWRLRRPSGALRPLVEEAGAVAEALGISEPRLRVTHAAPSACMPIEGDPPTLVVGAQLLDTTLPEERLFLFARALKVAASHMAPALRARPEELDAALLALLQGHDPSRQGAASSQQMLDLRKKLLKAVPRRWRDEVESLVLELAGHSTFSTRLVPFAVSSLGDRVALTLTGDVPAAVNALLKISGTAPDLRNRLQAVRQVPEAWGLVRFALSDAHFEARAQAGVDP